MDWQGIAKLLLLPERQLLDAYDMYGVYVKFGTSRPSSAASGGSAASWEGFYIPKHKRGAARAQAEREAQAAQAVAEKHEAERAAEAAAYSAYAYAFEDEAQAVSEVSAEADASGVPAQAGDAFERARADVCERFIGQDAYVAALFDALKRPFVQRGVRSGVRGVVGIVAPPASGRRTSCRLAMDALVRQQVLPVGGTANIDLAAYTADERGRMLFLSDLYIALTARVAAIVFDNIEAAPAAASEVLCTLALVGELALDAPCTLRNGVLEHAPDAPLSSAVQTLRARGVYLVFLARNSLSFLDVYGSAFLKRLDGIARMEPYTRADARVLAARLLNELAVTCRERLHVNVDIDADVLEHCVENVYVPGSGFAGILAFVEHALAAPLEALVERLDEPLVGLWTLSCAMGTPTLSSGSCAFELERVASEGGGDGA